MTIITVLSIIVCVIGYVSFGAFTAVFGGMTLQIICDDYFYVSNEVSAFIFAFFWLFWPLMLPVTIVFWVAIVIMTVIYELFVWKN